MGIEISIDKYIMQNWVKVPMMISFRRVADGVGANNLTLMIMEALEKGGNLNLTFVI
jgi:hypothetical protein